MKITLPENISDITLSQYQRLEELNTKLTEEEITLDEYNKRKINLFSGIPYRKIDNVAMKDLSDVMTQINKALNEDAEFVSRFKMNGIEYGFIPNFDNITTAEYVDLSKYNLESETLHNLMAILFRPITKDSLGNYDIETYKGTAEHANTMKQTPLNIVNGAVSFFFHLSSELEVSIQKYTKEVLRKELKQQNILKNGIGTQH